MKLIYSYVKKFKWLVAANTLFKIIATFMELMIPYILQHLIDNVAPTKNLPMIFVWGVVMLVLAVFIRYVNIKCNRGAARVARGATYDLRRDLFYHSIHLSGHQTDEFGLPSLTSRMTVDSYNIQEFIRVFQTIAVRAPMLMLGGIIVTLIMDPGLSLILCVLAPLSVFLVIFASLKGIPLYDKVQRGVDDITRVMRENITGIRVVKALSKENYEMNRFADINEDMYHRERKASVIMSLPGPIMTVILNIGLILVVLVGAIRVDRGVTEPGVILAFLTYFNMILTTILGLNRVFLMMSKANASANRIAAVIHAEEELHPLSAEEAAQTENKDAHILFDNVSFCYGKDSKEGNASAFAGEKRQMSLENISFSMKKGSSLGIIGPTGCGKTTIINLLMRFYDPTQGHVFIDGNDVRTYDKSDLHRMFGVVFQNDIIFADTLENNITFGRDISEDALYRAVADARAAEFVEAYEDRYQHMAAIRGANLSGGQRQRILIARALAADPKILILDDSSSALDYKTDAALRQAIQEHHGHTTSIIVAQRVSSIMNLDHILVMDEGRVIGQGTHEELLRSCPQYADIYKTQMGEEE